SRIPCSRLRQKPDQKASQINPTSQHPLLRWARRLMPMSVQTINKLLRKRPLRRNRMNSDQHDFEQFMKQRDKAARVYVSGEAGPLGEIAARHSPATFFPPRGGYHRGAEAVWSAYERGPRPSRVAPRVSWRSYTWRRATAWPTGLVSSAPRLTCVADQRPS